MKTLIIVHVKYYKNHFTDYITELYSLLIYYMINKEFA